jgi:hypothetical protein
VEGDKGALGRRATRFHLPGHFHRRSGRWRGGFYDWCTGNMNLDSRRSLLDRADQYLGHFEDAPSDFVINIGSAKYIVNTNQDRKNRDVQSDGHQKLPENLILSDFAILP